MNITYIQNIIKERCFKNNKLISYYCRRIWWEKNNLLNEYNFIIQYVKNLSNELPFAGKIWHVLNECQTDIICSTNKCNKLVKWIGKGYGNYCSYKCAANSKEGKLRRSQTLTKLNLSNKFFQLNRKKALKYYWKSNNSLLLREHLSKLAKDQHNNTDLDDRIRHYYNTTFHGSNNQKNRSVRMIKYNKSIQRIQQKKEDFYINLSRRCPDVSPQFTLDNYNGVKHNKYIWLCNHCNTLFNDDINNGSFPTCPKCFPYDPHISKKEKELSNFIKSLGMTTILNSRDIIPPKELDIYIPDKLIAFEFNGQYWHSDNNGKGRMYHLEKTLKCNEKNIQLIHIWEHHWNSKKELIKRRIKSKLCLNSITYARKTIFKSINENIKDYLNDNHMQGYCNSALQYGLYYNNMLVALMTFSKSRYNKQYELLRFCNIGNINVIGGASKLFKNFQSIHNPTSVISYSDKSWNTGNVYKKMGFNYSHSSNPSYQYTKDYYNFENKIKFQKYKLSNILDIFDNKLTEWENMKLNKYDRIWDCGNDVWIWKK